MYHFSDTLKRHERLHIRNGPDEQKTLKRKASVQSTRSPQLSHVGLFSSIEPRLSSGYVEAGSFDPPKTVPDEILFMRESELNPATKLQVSSTYSIPIAHPMEVSPAHGGDFTPPAFDFDLAALNEFLTSGDLDALTSAPALSTQTETVPTPPPLTALPRPSDAIKLAWFTNMEEKDLEKTSYSRLQQADSSTTTSTNATTDMDIENTGAGEIDEAWRQKVSTNLIPKVFNVVGPLPSIEFLVPSSSDLHLTRRICALICTFRNFMLWYLLNTPHLTKVSHHSPSHVSHQWA
jgi:hypothetical protein